MSVVPALAAYAVTFANPVAVSDSPVPVNVAVVGATVNALLPDASFSARLYPSSHVRRVRLSPQPKPLACS